MKRSALILFATFLIEVVPSVTLAQDGHLQRASDKTAGEQSSPPAKPADKDAASKSAKSATPATPAAQTAKNTATPVQPPASKPAAGGTLPPGIPAGAVKQTEYTWSYTDPQGKEWLYQQTPFGVSRRSREEMDRIAVAGVAAAATFGKDWKVVESGDELHFEEPTPFGPRKWTRKKSELSPNEQAVWDRLKKKD